MISGRIAATEEARIFTFGFSPSSIGALLGGHEQRGGAVVERTRVARSDRAVLPEGGLQRGELLDRRARVAVRRPSSPSPRAPRPRCPPRRSPCARAPRRHDLGVEMARLLRRDCSRLRDHRPLVLRLAADLAALGDVLRRQAHGDVDVVHRALGAVHLWLNSNGAPPFAREVASTAGGDVGVALAGLDRVVGHARRLQRGGTEAVDGGPGNVVIDARDAARRCGRCCSPARPRESRIPSSRRTTEDGSSCGLRSSSALSGTPARSSPRTDLNDPFTARPMGVRTASTITASGILGVLLHLRSLRKRLGRQELESLHQTFYPHEVANCYFLGPRRPRTCPRIARGAELPPSLALALSRTRDRGYRSRRETPSSSKPTWWASSWRTVLVTCSRSSSGSWPKSRRRVSRKMMMRSCVSVRAVVPP